MPGKYLFSSNCRKHLWLIKLTDCIISFIKELIITFTFAMNTVNQKTKFSPNVDKGGP